MKNINSYLVMAFLMLAITLSANNNSIACDMKNSVTCKIESYLSSMDLNLKAETVTIFSNFIVNQNGDLLTIDFMITEDGNIEILSKNFEEEYYKVDTYNTVNLEQYSFPVAQVKSDLVQA
jgi:hypothetical protein